MRIDLQSARVRPFGHQGIAHRTASGFVSLGTSDSSEQLAIVEAQSKDPKLIETLVESLRSSPPLAFSIVFTSQGELFVLACGSALIEVQTATVRMRLAPQPDQVVVQRIDIGLSDPNGRILLTNGEVTPTESDELTSLIDLQTGTVLADGLELTVARTTVPLIGASASSEPIDHRTSGRAGEGESSPTTDEVPQVPEALSESIDHETPVADATDTAEPPAVTPAPVSAAPEGATSPDATPSVDPPDTAAAPNGTADTPPAARDLVFADDPNPTASGASGGAVALAPSTFTQAASTSAAVAVADERVHSNGAEAPVDAIIDLAVPTSPASPSSQPAFKPSLPDLEAPAELDDDETVDDTPRPLAGSTTVGPAMVLGVACPNGHHNHPESIHCSQCGSRMGAKPTTVLLNGPRPPLGVLVVDDGSTWSLSSDLIIGREPSGHPDVLASRAATMTLSDDTLSLSRQHARIVLDDWSAYVLDLGSSNGTWINRDRSAQEWSPIPQDLPTPLESGDRLRVGGRIVQIELHHGI